MEGSSHRVALWFAAATALLLAALGVVLGQQLRSGIEQRALESAEIAGTIVARTIVDPLFRAEDLVGGGVPAERAEELQAQLLIGLVPTPVNRVKVFTADGTIAFSDEVDIVGDNHGISGAVADALEGEVASELEYPADEAHASEQALGPVLEVFVPVERLRSSGDPVRAVYEIYLPYRQTLASIDAQVRRLHLLLAAGLVVVWLALLGVELLAAARLRDAAQHRWMAHHDVLTGLGNRHSFQASLAQDVNRPLALLLIDLDRFKQINDAHGHHVGDALLQEVSRRMASVMRPQDTIARIGGDEFAVSIASNDPLVAHHVAERLREAVTAPITVGPHTLEIGASIGIALAPDDGADSDELMCNADAAMYRAKQQQSGIVAYASIRQEGTAQDGAWRPVAERTD